MYRKATRAYPVAFYIILSAVAVYGDLAKRFFSSTLSLAILYGIVVAIVCYALFTSGRVTARQRGVSPMRTSAYLIIAIYSVHAAISLLKVEEFRVLVAYLYVVVPLSLMLAVSFGRYFDISKFATIFLIFTIPTSLISYVQYFVDPSFFISQAYVETGGIILRNFLDASGYFSRLPSIYVSSDRFASISACQAFLSVVLLSSQEPIGRWRKLLAISCLAMSLLNLGIAGSRSRILIIGVLTLVSIIAVVYQSPRSTRGFRRMLMLVGIAVFAAIFSLLLTTNSENAVVDFPVVRMLEQTFQSNDIEKRLTNAYEYSLLRTQHTMLGQGLGSLTPNGTPGEFGIRSMWLETGLLFTPFILAGYVVLLVSVLRGGMRALSGNLLGEIWMFMFPAAILTSGLIVGIKYSFEISTAVTVFAILGAVSQRTFNPRAKSSRQSNFVASRNLRGT